MTCSAVLIHYKACDGRTDYGIAVVYTCYIIGIGLLSRVKTSNATNFKKAFRHAGRLFEIARLRQTKSSYDFFCWFQVQLICAAQKLQKINE